MKLLLIAYAIAPGKGSEEGVGYHLCKGIAQRFRDVTLITRPNNIPELRRDPALGHVTFVGIDVPRILGFFKKKGRGILLYYFFWQITVGIYLHKMQTKGKKFDILHQITFAAAWAPHFFGGIRGRIFWGPLLNNPDIPRDFWFRSVFSFYFREISRRFLRFYFFRIDPMLHRAIRRTDIIFMASPFMPDVYRRYPEKIHLLPNASSIFPVLEHKERSKVFTVLYVGRFLDIKGVVPALEAYRLFHARLAPEDKKSVAMKIVGQGPLEDRVGDRLDKSVTLFPWMEQNDLQALYEEARVFLFPSLESQGMVVVEALSQGCPVICLENTGPAFLAGPAACAVGRGSYAAVVESLADKLYALYQEYYDYPDRFELRVKSALMRACEFSWSRKIDRIVEAYFEKGC